MTETVEQKIFGSASHLGQQVLDLGAQLEHLGQVASPALPRRRESEEQAGDERHAGRDAKDARVERDRFEARQVRRNVLGNSARQPGMPFPSGVMK